MVKLKATVSNPPSSYGYNVWDGPTVADYISKEYGVGLTVRACHKLLHKLGFSLFKSQTYPSLANADEDAHNELKKLRHANKDPKLIPAFQDEVRFKAQTTSTRKWCLKGSEPKVMSKPGNNSIAYGI